MARKTKSQRPAQRAEPLTCAEWKAWAVALMGGRAGTMPEREWKRAYILGVNPDNVPKLADTYRQNVVAADRSRKRR